MVAAEAEFDRIAHRRPADDFHLGAIAKAHFQQPPADIRIAAYGEHMALAPHAELVQPACFGGAAMVASREFTSFLHERCSVNRTGQLVSVEYIWLRLSFKCFG